MQAKPYPSITFSALRNVESPADVQRLAAECNAMVGKSHPDYPQWKCWGFDLNGDGLDGCVLLDVIFVPKPN